MHYCLHPHRNAVQSKFVQAATLWVSGKSDPTSMFLHISDLSFQNVAPTLSRLF